MKLYLLSGAIQIKTNCLKKLMKALKKSCGRILAVRQFLYYGVRVPTTRNNNKKAIRYKYLMAFLVRWKGLEPPTYWFVASHSIQLSYQRIPIKIYQLIQLLTKCPQVDLVVRSQTLYPTELPARMQKHYCAFAQII